MKTPLLVIFTFIIIQFIVTSTTNPTPTAKPTPTTRPTSTTKSTPTTKPTPITKPTPTTKSTIKPKRTKMPSPYPWELPVWIIPTATRYPEVTLPPDWYNPKTHGACVTTQNHTWPKKDISNLFKNVHIDLFQIGMSSNNLARELGNRLIGNKSLSKEFLSKMCLEVNPNNELTAYINGTRHPLLNCNYTNTENINCFSSPDSPPWNLSGNINMNIVWVDGHWDEILVVLCPSASLESFWAFLSLGRFEGSPVKEQVLSKVTELGFDPTDVIYYDYRDCPQIWFG